MCVCIIREGSKYWLMLTHWGYTMFAYWCLRFVMIEQGYIKYLQGNEIYWQRDRIWYELCQSNSRLCRRQNKKFSEEESQREKRNQSTYIIYWMMVRLRKFCNQNHKLNFIDANDTKGIAKNIKTCNESALIFPT